MKLHILSDLHLSQGGLEVPNTGADVIVLAGDIARPDSAVSWAKALGKPVLYVPGNHEFYGGTLSGTVAQLRSLSDGTCIQVLYRDERVIDGVRFLGVTLWTDFLLRGEEARACAMEGALHYMRDFSRIRLNEDAGGPWTPADSAVQFQRDAAWLAERLAQPHCGPTVVITHHAPSARSVHPRYAQSLVNACFASNAEHLLGGDRVQLWIHGHTHDSFDYEVNGTRVLCNPRGYLRDGVNENALFEVDKVVVV